MDLSPDEDYFQGRLLHQAALWDNVELLQELVCTAAGAGAAGAGVDARDASGRTALHAAALQERSRCLAALLAAGASVDARSDAATGGKTALHIAAERGHVENVRALVAGGADVLAPDAGGDTALALAERRGHRHAARALRDARDALERERLLQHAQLRELVARGDTTQLRARLAALGPAAGIVANLTPNGANTLLYVASEAGVTAAVCALLAAGADGRAHPVTRYGPLYVAAYHGHADIARLLLAHFPRAAQQETVEKWLPLHAACIGGHAHMVTLLLEHGYPEEVLDTYTDPTGQWQYRAAFDINAVDASGQSALYIAATLGSLPAVEALLGYRAPCVRVTPQTEEESPPPPPATLSPPRAGISLGIHAIVNKLTGSSTKKPAPPSQTVRPARLDSPAGDSSLAAAARGGHTRVVKKLLEAGASPDAPARPPDCDPTGPDPRSRRRSRSACPAPGGRAAASPSPSPARYTDRDGPWTALALAARAKNVQIVELLLSHGATDTHGRALRECARHGLTELVTALLATKAYPDPDFKLNKSAISESVFNSRSDAALTYSALCPSTPVAVHWRDLRCQRDHLRMSWVRAACLRVNSKLSSGGAALLALTRLDVAGNELRLLPRELFSLLSVRYINAAQNKLERLPSPSDPLEEELDPRSKKGKRRPRPEVYSAPLLQELYLQDNRLEELPPALFSLPSLATLDVSNNKLRALPPALWAAPALADLNAALNLLRDLPAGDQSQSEGSPLSPSESSPQLSASPSLASGQFPFNAPAKSWSRSPSIERSESEPADDDTPLLGDRTGNAVCSPPRRAHTWRGVVEPAPPRPPAGRPLAALNLAHNQFSCVPPALACRAPQLLRLNMAYNSLRSMSYVTSYPTSLRQLDLSHNEITCWPSLPQVENFSSSEGDPLACYCQPPPPPRRPLSRGSVRAQLLSAACPARRHLRLDALRTLILANNLLTRIQLTTDDDGCLMSRDDNDDDDDDEWSGAPRLQGRLLFPLLSMLDVSSNLLRAVPPHIHALTHLAVLNLAGNRDITELPPTMGLLSRLWNLSCAGCSLQEPLRSMLQSGQYKSMELVGYLKSVLQEARPYARMKLMLAGVQGIGKTSLLECLRQESSIQHRRKPTDHWAKRMGNKSSRRGNLSTVGVDIGLWVCDRQRARGAVTFTTWDFGGQQEYYATHQYFLSRRSLYLVVWKVTDGRKGLATAVHWLRSIQARAPSSPVIMVATHYDQVANSTLPESESPEALQRIIRTSIMGAPDADKLGLPRVLDSVEVSCSTRHNIRLLADIIYSVAFSVKPPGSKEPLLEQRVPATYLALEECVTSLAASLREPVLRHDEYRRLVTQYMQQKNLRTFRDAAELHQATMFLHENGVLLHYDDANLKELYFLKPQWLCDVLAHVVTVREINPFASNGIMKLEDLAHVFKASPQLARGEEAGALGVSLLNKFELALCWDARTLLVPPLLPLAEPADPQLPLCPAGRGGLWGRSNLQHSFDTPRRTDSPQLVDEPSSSASISGRGGGWPLRRLLLVSYVPLGFWARLVARVLPDAALRRAAAAVYAPPPEMEVDDTVAQALDLAWGWKLWRSGLKLCCGDLTLLSVRELPPTKDPLLADTEAAPRHDYTDLRLRVKQEGAWCELDVECSACIELLLPAQVCQVRRRDGAALAGYQSISLEPNAETLAKVLATISDHVDLLLEDWYPSLGTRFVHTSEGRCLITRLVPCPACLRDEAPHCELPQAFRRLELAPAEVRRPRLSEESRTSDGDSGVGAESNASSRIGSVEGMVNPSSARVAFAWSVEECILCACTNTKLHCAHHSVTLRDVAPDTLLLDVEPEKRACWEHLTLAGVAGRGAFGTVLRARWAPPGHVTSLVAVKALQPVLPAGADLATLHAHRAAVCRWERDPLSAACRAYCSLRQELSVLGALRHAHVLPLLAAASAPLALLLPLAPMGALDAMLRSYRECGRRVSARIVRCAALQVARALEYLHARRVVYRDLKSENVLVWSMPRPHEPAAAETSSVPLDVHLKLADYGISRMAPVSGTKGFGGTEGFMAPEIMRYHGEEEYNEKVDCFSYGMLLYELVSLRQPFEGHEAVKEAVLDGARPALSPRELQYPCLLLETMRRCWSGDPSQRPSAAALVCVCAAPELGALQDVTACAPARPPALAHPLRTVGPEEGCGWEVWWGGGGREGGRAHALQLTSHAFTAHTTLRVQPLESGEEVSVTAMCRVGGSMWLGDSAGRLSIYCISTLSLVWSVAVWGAVGGAPSPVTSLLSLTPLPRVAMALQCGRLFVVLSSPAEAEGGFVLTELGTATTLCALVALPTPAGVEVWAGGAGLYSYTLQGGAVSGADTLLAPDTSPSPAPSSTPTPSTVLHTLLAADEDLQQVFAYCEPGVFIYQWCAREKVLLGRIDVSKLAPCSESLQSLAPDEGQAEERHRVTSLCTYRGSLYAGSAWGCVLVAHAQSLRPLTVLRPHDASVLAILPLPPPPGANGAPLIASLGSGYRPLLNRFAPQQAGNTQTHSGYYCLLWRAQHWLPD